VVDRLKRAGYDAEVMERNHCGFGHNISIMDIAFNSIIAIISATGALVLSLLLLLLSVVRLKYPGLMMT
jgi:hypothetical protein